MTWLEMYGMETEPDTEQMAAYVASPLWGAMRGYLQAAYGAQPRTAFSGCSGQPGWNVKYQKGGRSLCTLYPMQGYYIALVVVGERERQEVELLMPTFSPTIQALYGQADGLTGAKWLMIPVTDEAVFEDVKRLIAARRKPKG